MSSPFKRNISLTGDTNFTGIKRTDSKNFAAGLPAIKVALQHTFKEMGALEALSTLSQMNQKEGFDCAGCAWPDPEKPSQLGEYCENGAKALAEEATYEKVDADFFQKYSVEEISHWSDFKIGKSGRLTQPLLLKEGSLHYKPISWADAFSLIAKNLMELNSPDEAIFYTSGRSSNEAAFLYGLFVRAFGTNNMPDCSNMCHESSGVALSETLGIGKGSVKLEDLYKAEIVIVAGQNPGTNHPRMLSALEKCKANGGKVISINPLAETGLVNFKNPQSVSDMLGNGQPIADIHLPVKINEDIALAKLILKKLVALDAKNTTVLDHEFIVEYVDGYDDLLKDLDRHEEESLQQRSGVYMHKIDKVVELLAENSKIVICWAMGITQHKNAVDCIKEYVNILLLKGAVGKPFAGTCPVRGHSNVQGDRSVGIMHYVNKGLNERIQKHLNFDPPTEKGYDTVEAIEAMHEKKAKVFVCLGGNFVMAASDTKYTAEAIQNCELTVQISTKLNRSHLVTGKTALLLPTFGRSEKDEKNGELQFLTMESSTGKVRQSKGLLKPASEHIKSEPEIIALLAHTYFRGNHSMNWYELGQDYNLIRELIDKTVKGFEKTSEQSKGFGCYLPNNVRNRDFRMLPNGMAQLSITPLPDHQLKPDELLLMTIRSHDQFNTTIYGLNDRYRGIHNERRVVFMNAEDMAEKGLTQLDVVNLHSMYDGVKRTAERFIVVLYEIPKGNMAAYFPETNLLVPYNHFADKSQTPISKSIKVSVEKVS